MSLQQKLTMSSQQKLTMSLQQRNVIPSTKKRHSQLDWEPRNHNYGVYYYLAKQ